MFGYKRTYTCNTCTCMHVVLDLKEKVSKLEKEFKDQLFELETRMLKTIAENKTYIVRKIKEYKETTDGKKTLHLSPKFKYMYMAYTRIMKLTYLFF